jgi:hypothetical protein
MPWALTSDGSFVYLALITDPAPAVDDGVASAGRGHVEGGG